LLLGASLAIALAIRSRPNPARRTAHSATTSPRPAQVWARQALSAASLLLLAALGAGLVVADGDDSWLYPFGMLATDAVMVVLIAAVVFRPRALGARVLALSPLRAVGRISYGLYL